MITPTNELYIVGQNNMFLSAMDAEKAVFTRDASKAMSFSPDKEKQRFNTAGLQSGAVYLYPIRFEHAKNIDWYGRMISNNIASNNQIKDKIIQLKKELEKNKVYSFSSDFFTKGNKWTPETCYSPRSLKTQYFGLIPSLGNIF